MEVRRVERYRKSGVGTVLVVRERTVLVMRIRRLDGLVAFETWEGNSFLDV